MTKYKTVKPIVEGRLWAWLRGINIPLYKKLTQVGAYARRVDDCGTSAYRAEAERDGLQVVEMPDHLRYYRVM